MRVIALMFACFSMLLAAKASARAAQDIGGALYGAMNAVYDKDCLVASKSRELSATDKWPRFELAMTQYWSLAGSGDSVDIHDVFQNNKEALWVKDGKGVQVKSGIITDPYARTAGNILVGEPIAIAHAGRGSTARGVWVVKTKTGDIAGYYLVDFRDGSNGRPQRLELLPAASPPPSIRPYCQSPGDIDAYLEEAKSMTDTRVEKILRKATVIANCQNDADCAEKWSRAQQWINDKSVYPFLRNTEALLLTSGPVFSTIDLAYVAALDPPAPDGRRAIRFRAWCGNYFICLPKPAKARDLFSAAIEGRQSTDSNAPG